MKKIGFFCLIIFTFLFLTNFAAAETKTIEQVLESIQKALYFLAILLTVIMILVSAFLFLISGGDLDKINQAKRALFYAILGLLIASAAKGISDLIIKNITK